MPGRKRFNIAMDRVKLLRCFGKIFLDRHVSDEKYIRLLYRMKMGRCLNLIAPQTFSEKIQWLKLYWRQDILTQCADKYAVRKYVADRVGPELLKKLYGVYEKAEDVDLSRLPDAFVLKVNHGCKQNIFCRRKSEIDWNRSSRLLKEYLKDNLYYTYREWAYKNIVPRIICEEHLQKNGEPMYEYSFYCYDGVPRTVEIFEGEGGCSRGNMFDLNLNLLENKYKNHPLTLPVRRPLHFDRMLDYAEKLSAGFPFVRVDFLDVNNRVCFGEMTFYPLAGMARINPESFDYFLGSYLKLPAAQF